MGTCNVLITNVIEQSLPSTKGCLYCGEPPDHTTVWSGYYWPVISNFIVRFLTRTFEKLEKVWKNLFLSNIASWGTLSTKNTKISFLAKLLNISKIFDIFWFLYQPWTIQFWYKNFDIFFLEKLPKFGGFLWFFQNVTKKSARAKTAAGSRRTGWCYFESEKLPKFVKFRRFFTKFSKISNLIFVPTMNDLILE